MNTPVTEKLLNSIDVETNLLPFLILSGWEQNDYENSRWIILYGENDVDGHPLELVFPREGGYEGKRQYIAKAIELLTVLRNEPMQLVMQGIINYDRDMLYVRNTETDVENAIAFQLAVDQVNNLKRTIQYSACSEKDAKPYFSTINPLANKIFRNFLFGHTIAGSFGFTVEAPRLPDPPKFIQSTLPLGDDYSPPPLDIPIERRIMERIARGLTYTKQAEVQRNHNVLIREYASGFNSNMCSAIVGMSKDKRPSVEFRIIWSPKIKPGDDVAGISPTRIQRDGYDMLEYSSAQLKALEPEFVSIIGHVKGLTSSDNPFSLGTRRAVVIHGTYLGIQREVDIIVELEREDYLVANKAHIEWRTVSVNGVLSRSGGGWRLSNARDLRILS